MCKDGIRGLGVGGAQLASTAANGADHHRDLELAAKHIAQLGGFVDDVVHR